MHVICVSIKHHIDAETRAGARLLELDDVGMQEHAVVHNLPLNISPSHLLSSLDEFDCHLHIMGHKASDSPQVLYH